MTDQPEAQPETATPRPSIARIIALGSNDSAWAELVAAARAAGFREGAAEGAARYREARQRIVKLLVAARIYGGDPLIDSAVQWADEWLADNKPLPEAREPGISVEPDSLALAIERAEAVAEMRWHDHQPDRWVAAQQHLNALRQLLDDRQHVARLATEPTDA